MVHAILPLGTEGTIMNKPFAKPKTRSALRRKLGVLYYGSRRKFYWILMWNKFASSRSTELLPYTYFTHHTPLIRKLKDTEMWMQENKIVNLRNAVARIDGVILRPGETFSYWKLIGNPSRRRGYKEGMILVNGTVQPGVGGGLCQLSNLIFWMTLHTPLTVVERHRHAYDVFPDSNRTQPFGSGATCYYPYGDLMIRNDTEDTYQLKVKVGKTDLEGAWHVSGRPLYSFKIVEKDHEMRSEFWGGFTRHNKLYREQYDLSGDLVSEELVVENSAVMMYSPFIEQVKAN